MTTLSETERPAWTLGEWWAVFDREAGSRADRAVAYFTLALDPHDAAYLAIAGFPPERAAEGLLHRLARRTEELLRQARRIERRHAELVAFTDQAHARGLTVTQHDDRIQRTVAAMRRPGAPALNGAVRPAMRSEGGTRPPVAERVRAVTSAAMC